MSLAVPVTRITDLALGFRGQVNVLFRLFPLLSEFSVKSLEIYTIHIHQLVMLAIHVFLGVFHPLPVESMYTKFELILQVLRFDI